MVQLRPGLIVGHLLILEVGLDEALEGVGWELEAIDDRLKPLEDGVLRMARVAGVQLLPRQLQQRPGFPQLLIPEIIDQSTEPVDGTPGLPAPGTQQPGSDGKVLDVARHILTPARVLRESLCWR
jgi:hypothetical protein